MTDDSIIIYGDDMPESSEVNANVSDATDTDVDLTINDATDATDDTATTRGRPRPEDVVKRDELVYTSLIGPMTRQAVAVAANIKPSHAYLSLLRLRNNGRVQHERTGSTGHIWSRTTSV